MGSWCYFRSNLVTLRTKWDICGNISGHTLHFLCNKTQHMNSNTGDNLRRWLDVLRVKKRELDTAHVIGKSNLYRLFLEPEVPWTHIVDIHNYLRTRYEYNIREFFPDFPEQMSEVRSRIEHLGDENTLARRLLQERDMWREKYLSSLERYSQLQDRVIGDLSDLMESILPLQKEILARLMEVYKKK